MSSYCTPTDVYAHVPPGTFANPGRVIASVSTSTEVIDLDGHGLTTDEPVTFRADDGKMPAPLVRGTTYYARTLGDSQFSVAAAPGGSAINLTSSGSNVVMIRQLPIAEWIVWASAMVENFLPAHMVPLDAPYPAIVVTVTASLAAARGLQYSGGSQIDITQKLADAQQMLARWSKGIPLRGAGAPRASANAAITSSAGGADPRGWLPRGGGGVLP